MIKQVKHSFLLISVTFLCFTCIRLPSKDLIEQVQWLIGTWENKTQRGSVYESWVKVNDTEFMGKSFSIKDGDTIVFETIKLVEEQNSLFFVPTVSNQNDQQPIRFSLIKLSASELIFENKSHDFPQVISYRKVHQDSLLAEISGIQNGQNNKRQFPMVRVK